VVAVEDEVAAVAEEAEVVAAEVAPVLLALPQLPAEPLVEQLLRQLRLPLRLALLEVREPAAVVVLAVAVEEEEAHSRLAHSLLLRV
jgi:hypothetical protein